MRIKFSSLIFIALISTLPLLGQRFTYSLERVVHSAGIQFGAGFFNGVGDNLQFHYDQTIFPRPGEKFLWGGHQYWNPQVSWRNKYKNWPADRREAFPLSSSALAWTTDAWHLTNTLERTAHRVTIVTYRQPEGPGKGWKKLIDIGLMSLSYSAGWITANSLTTKK